VTRYGYDNESHLTSITDANNHTTSFSYWNGLLWQTTFPSTYNETYNYDYMNNLTSKTDRKSQTISYTYDRFDQVTSKYIGRSLNYTYDTAGHLTKVTDGSDTYQFAYDRMGRLIQTQTTYSFVGGRTFTVSYAYDAAGNRTTLTDPANGVTNYSYDSLNRLTGLADFNSNSFGFIYDALSRRTQLTRPNGISSNYAYDNLSRLLSVLHQVGGTTVDGATYTYDNAGNRTSKLNYLNAVTENYTYDQIYQLTQVVDGLNNTTEAYTYDSVGNRLSSLGASPYTYNSSNQLLSTPTTTYTYDKNGNTSTKVDSSGTTTYAWDYENRLTSLTLPGSGGTVTYKYDPFGRRTQKVGPSGTTNYIYDGANVIEEVDGTGTVLARYSQGPGIDQPLSDVVSGVAKYYDADGLGSVTSLADISGSLTDTYTTDSFGKTTASSGTTRNPYRYTARDLDSETGLYYYRARYYDPQGGRFANEDPTGFEGGINLYSYVANNPVVRVDPTGLSFLDFARSSGTLRLYYADGSLALECSAANRALGNGPWPSGWYYFDRHNRHAPDANGPYGSYGIYIFRVPGRTGMGVHSGRANQGGPNHPTRGCVRTTDSCMEQIMRIVATDPLTSIYIDNDSSHR
jgi:RHS repeat-associated protein